MNTIQELEFTLMQMMEAVINGDAKKSKATVSFGTFEPNNPNDNTEYELVMEFRPVVKKKKVGKKNAKKK